MFNSFHQSQSKIENKFRENGHERDLHKDSRQYIIENKIFYYRLKRIPTHNSSFDYNINHSKDHKTLKKEK